MHEVRVKQAKEGRLIAKATLRQCVASAEAAIPDILARLRETADRALQWSFYGHLTAYLACIYGHHGGVFQNMTIAEVEAAKTGSKEGCFVINISTHKTNQAFGAAQLALSGEEYGWLTDFLDIRPYSVGGETANYFFFTSKPSSCKNLNQYFQEAWAGMGLPGSPTFTDIRTSIATHAKNSHTPGDRQKVAQFMCHDTSTADRFYALNLDAKQAAEHRRPGVPKAWKKTGKRAGKSSGKRPAASLPTSSSPSPACPPPPARRPLAARRGSKAQGNPLPINFQRVVISVNWIGNYKRKASSKPRPSKAKVHIRELSPYNLFCRDILSNKGTMNDIKSRWATLGEDGKNKYIEEAAALRAHGQALSPEMRDARIKMHLKKLKLEAWKKASFARH
ncbi:hypothetical protein DPX16_3532 [Anabarilius grahami]|uniref:Uncharacterized protein n=1 Tax=Anabarilius grahami TaxID=495550 RepID=A0A3N0YYZ2_ANAGA|nr:hypothetical protein DPX16_3532 [Anabarilius grahami]